MTTSLESPASSSAVSRGLDASPTTTALDDQTISEQDAYAEADAECARRLASENSILPDLDTEPAQPQEGDTEEPEPPPDAEAATIPSGTDGKSDEDLVDQYGEPLFFHELKGGASVLSGFNERFFAARFYRDGNILFEPCQRSFYEYNRKPESGLWKPASDDHIREALSAQILKYGRSKGHHLESKVTTPKTGAVLQSLRGIAERREAFARRSDYVHVRNGVIRFKDQGHIELTGFDPADFSRNCCPVDFRPDADCPRFLNELLGPALPPDDIDFLQRWFGLALAGINPAQRFVILDGDAATGKSTFAAIVQHIIGAENCAQLRTALLFERFEIFRFCDKTLLLAPDVPGDFLNHPAASVLKSLVGGDPLTAEAKQSNSVFTLAGNFNVLITSNSRLRVRLDGDAGAWRRRIVIIRFEQPPPVKRIARFAETLFAEEGPGIVRWALAGYLAAREEIATTGDLTLTRDQQGRVDALLSESDSVRRFLTDATERADGDVSSNELTEAYFHFCADRQWTPQPARYVERNLTDLILELFGASKCHRIPRDGRSVRGWQGVILKAPKVHENDSQPPFDYAEP
jgi:P4 family phage/plasmid primase-like protien